MGVKLVSSSGGSVELVAPTTASNFALTVPANNGTVITTASTFGGTGPAFSAYRNGGNQSVSSSVFTKAQLDAEMFDTNNCFDSTTNFRFTPNVAGYYYLTGKIDFYGSGGTITAVQAAIYKNGLNYATGNFIASPGTEAGCLVSNVVYLNGSTDYVELYGHVAGTGLTFLNGILNTRFDGFLARAA